MALLPDEQARLDDLRPELRALATRNPIVRRWIARYVRGKIDETWAIHRAHYELGQWLAKLGEPTVSTPDVRGLASLVNAADKYLP